MPSAQLTKLAPRVLRVLNSNNLSNKLYHSMYGSGSRLQLNSVLSDADVS